MKKTKVFLVSLILVIGLASAMVISTQLYTKERVSEIGIIVGYNAFQQGSLDLGSLLYINYDYRFLNEETGENNWRNMLAADPTLAYTAVDLYSTDFLEGFEEGFEENSDLANTKKVLRKLEGIENRDAKFVTVLCVIKPDEKPIFIRGEVSGYILETITGDGGFGYDPIFTTDHLSSFAEMTMEEKQAISHRGLALKALFEEKLF